MRDVVVLVVLHIVLGCVYLDSVPRIFVDEVWDSSVGYNLARTGTIKHPFIEGLGGIHIHLVQTRMVLALVCAAFFSFADYSIFLSRFASVIFGALAVISLYAVMRRWFGQKQAFWIGLATIIHPWFFEISRRARPEIYYTALGLIFLWLMVVYFDRASRRTAFFAGVVVGLLALTHPNGLILAFSIGVGIVLWYRNTSLGQMLGWASLGAALIILPYIIYVSWAIQEPGVSFAEQMLLDRLHRSFLRTEISRWTSFLQWPMGAPLAFIMLLSWIAAWRHSSAYDKTLATIVGLFVLILPFINTSAASRYLATTTPFFSALLVRLIWRIRTGEIGIWLNRYRLRLVIGASAAVIYLSTAVGGIGLVFYCLCGADFGRVVNRVATVVGPEARVYAPPIFWAGNGRYRYGPFLLVPEGIFLTEAIEMARKHDFDYAVRTSWIIVRPERIRRPPRSMPGFRNCLGDHLCRLFGTKVDEFHDPFYGPIEVYRLDWSKSPGM